MIRTTGAQLLEEIGYSVVLAENGLEAVNIFRQSHDEIDLVIMDMVMPVMSGREAIRKLRSIDQNCCVVVASGFAESGQGEGLSEYDIQGFIQKPYRISALSQILAQVLEDRRSGAAKLEKMNR
jgi:CheY-like chemotaxis protein